MVDQTVVTQGNTRHSHVRLPRGVKRVVVLLIKPSSYDEDGFVYRFYRGVVPANGVAVMYSLVRDALKRILPDSVEVEILGFDDGIVRHARDLKQLLRRFPEPGTKLIVGLVSVQSAQFPRACDIIRMWQKRGATCIIGGFHVSGSITTMFDGIDDPQRPGIPCPRVMPPEVQRCIDEGVVVFHGEAEGCLQQVLVDVLEHRQQQLYRGRWPDLTRAPLPEFPAGYYDGSYYGIALRTFDTSRGCPFKCSFCAIINTQGRKPRYRDPQAIIMKVKEICDRQGSASFFFSDDNFARSPVWKEILDGLGALRRRGCEISFMIQADLKCGSIPGFLEMLSDAGCYSIFMGVESLNPANLEEVGKFHNKVDEYETLWRRCHELGIMIQAAYIIGFTHDTPESVQRDVQRLSEMGADTASFYVLIPLPGTEDHVRLYCADPDAMDSDLNRFDSYRPVTDHPTMSRTQWQAAYLQAWRGFYSIRNMITVLKRQESKEMRWNTMRMFIFYTWLCFVERAHPMVAGFLRVRPYDERRPGAKSLSYGKYALQEFWRCVRYVGMAFAHYYVFQHIWCEAEIVPSLGERGQVLTGRLRGFWVWDWLRRTFGRAMNRRWLNEFWIAYGRNKWHLLLNPWGWRWHIKMLPYCVTEVVYTFRWAIRLHRLLRSTRAVS